MRRPMAWALALFLEGASCRAGPPAEPEPGPTAPVGVDPQVDPPPPDRADPPEPEPTAMPDPTHTLRLREPVMLDRENALRVEDVVIESIEADPIDPGSYPAGSGLDVTVVVQRGSYERSATLTRLSAGYQSRPVGWLEGHRITLLDVRDPHLHPETTLVVERVTDTPTDAPPLRVRVTKQGEVEMGDGVRLRFLGHGHKRTMPGQRSPLMVSVDWLVDGYEDERQSLNLGPDDGDMSWTWRDLQVTVDEYDYDDWMELSVRRLKLERVE